MAMDKILQIDQDIFVVVINTNLLIYHLESSFPIKLINTALSQICPCQKIISLKVWNLQKVWLKNRTWHEHRAWPEGRGRKGVAGRAWQEGRGKKGVALALVFKEWFLTNISKSFD